MSKMYFTISGCNHYFGNAFMKAGMKVKLKKEPDNMYDKEAIMVKVKGTGKCGYVANSPYTVKGESMSAGRIYDRLGLKAKAKIVYVIPGGAICKIIQDGKKDTKDKVREKLTEEIREKSMERIIDVNTPDRDENS